MDTASTIVARVRGAAARGVHTRAGAALRARRQLSSRQGPMSFDQHDESTLAARTPGAVQDPPVRLGPPQKQGLYDPRFEHDAGGQGFVVNIKGRKSHRVLEQAIQV